MKNKLALFPLNLVVFPRQDLNLHVFESRYKDLIKDCIKNNETFAIPAFIKEEIEYGTEMEITEVTKEYEDGRYDIQTRGRQIIRVTDMENPYQNKKYAVGEIENVPNKNNADVLLKEEIYESVQEMYNLVEVDNRILSMDFGVFDVAHHIGLSLQAEYELIQITEERQRQRFILNHLKVLIPKLRDVQRSKEKIQMNGHFRKYNPPEKF